MITFIIIYQLIVVAVLSIWFRKQITNLTGTVKDYAIGNWYRAYPVFRKALIVGGISWGILIVLMIGLGIYANSFWSALIISILFPIWFLSMLIPRRTVPTPAKWRIPIFGIVRVFGGTILMIAFISLAIGLWSPDTKGAINERSDDYKTWTANFFKKGSVHSERNAGVRGRTKSATEVFDEFNNPIEGIIPAGKIVMVLKNIQSKPATENREALLSVMLPNKHGNFVDGSVVWMPALKIEFINNEEQETKSESLSNVPAENQGSIWKIRYEKPEGGYSEWEKATVEKDGSQAIIRTVSNGRRIVFEGKEENGIFCGIWEQKDAPYKKGKFFFKTTLFEMDGYVTDFQEGEKKFPYQLKRP